MAWELTGNAIGTTAGAFLGTTDAQPLIVKTTPPTAGATPLERLRVTTEGRVGVGIANPQAKLTVAGGGWIINKLTISTHGLLGVAYPKQAETLGRGKP